MSPRPFLIALLALVPAGPAHALSFAGNATTVASGGPTQYIELSGIESTTGPLATSGTCSGATGQAWLSASAGALALRTACDGSPSVGCVSDSYASGNSSYSDEFLVQSATLPPGTLVDVSLCVRAALRHGIQFGCGGSVFEGVTSTAAAEVFIREGSNTPSVARGTYSERWNCFDGHDLAETGLFAPGAGDTTLTITQVPVGGIVTISASLTAATGEKSFTAADAGRIEMAVVFGYSAAGDVRLVSTANGAEPSASTNCSLANLGIWLPPPTGTVAVEPRIAPGRTMLFPPVPNPARGDTRLAFALPAPGPVELVVCDVTGARVARVASGWREAGTHHVSWNGRDDAGRAVRPGVYWVRLATANGRASRSVIRLP